MRGRRIGRKNWLGRWQKSGGGKKPAKHRLLKIEPLEARQLLDGLASTTSLAIVPNGPVAYGQAVTLAAQVSDPQGYGTPTGEVDFMDGTTDLGEFPPDGSGDVSLTTTALSVGSHTITASYDGDSCYASSAASGGLQVNAAATTTVLTNLPMSVPLGTNSLTLTANVSVVSPGGGSPTGSVDFYDVTTSTDLGSAPLDGSGEASFWWECQPSLGTQNITATYSGDGNFTGSISSPSALDVYEPASFCVNTSGTATYGESVTFTAFVQCSGWVAPTGTIDFVDMSTTPPTDLGTVDVAPIFEWWPGNGQYGGSVTAGGLVAGQHDITATYSRRQLATHRPLPVGNDHHAELLRRR